MALTPSDSRVARDRLGRYLLEEDRTTATEWDHVAAVHHAVWAATHEDTARNSELLGLPADAPAHDIATALQLLGSVRRQIDLAEETLIAAALAKGMSWERLGTAYGKNSRQAMQQHTKRLKTRIANDSDGHRVPLIAAEDGEQ